MDESQSDAIAQAILRPDSKVQEELRRKKAHKAWWLTEKRKITWLMLIGFAVGAAVALYSGQSFTSGGVWGAVSGGSVGWLWVGWRWHRRRRAA